MAKLNDMQLVLLSGAAQRDDRFVDLADNRPPATHRKLIAKLLNLGFLVEVTIAQGKPTWRTDPDGEKFGLQITDAGLIMIGIDPADGSEPKQIPAEQSGQIAKIDGSVAPISCIGSKTLGVLNLLRRDGGTTLTEITTLTNWLPHSARAALTGLRKKGHQIERFTAPGIGSSYRIVGTPAVDVSSDLGGQQ